EMAARGLPGRVIYLGCPAEEVLVGKGFMARGGAFTDLDCVVDFHPASTNVVSMGRSTAVYSANFHFKGITAHAAFDPQNGRSALDAVELMNVGANYLREHITSDVRLHYIITEGGVAPNIVPDRASSRYFVRAFTMDACKSVYDRLVKVARGAAMMTETELEIEYLGGCYERQPIAALAELLQAALSEAPRPVWDAADRELAAALNNTMPELTASIIATNNLPADSVLHDGVLPISYTDMFASTDVGDVQHIVPGASFTTATMNLGAPGHSWQTAACSGSAIGMKGMLYAAKTFALFGLKVLENPEVLAAAQADFQQKMQGKTYDCPVTPEMTVPGI
ncbi:MAG: amidohydrolase, partial [Actinomycetia bacterium]|nr:amidohydrolase [Actinomycetes bacterium]